MYRHQRYGLQYESDAQAIKRPLLDLGGPSDLFEGHRFAISPLHLYGVLADGGQVVKQGLEAVHGEPIVGHLGCRFPLGGLGALGRDHHVGTALCGIGRNASKYRSLLGVQVYETIMALIWVGYYDHQPLAPARRSISEVVRIL